MERKQNKNWRLSEFCDSKEVKWLELEAVPSLLACLPLPPLPAQPAYLNWAGLGCTTLEKAGSQAHRTKTSICFRTAFPQVCHSWEFTTTMADQTSPDYFNCSLCLNLLRDPVAIPCGHSFCMDCISGYWNEADYTGIYICPQCKITFTQRPVLRPNATLSMVAEKIKKSGLNLTVMSPVGNAEAERGEKQKLLGISQAEIKQKFQERVKELEELKTTVDSLKNSAQRAMVDSQKMFEDMIRSIERMRSEVTKLIGINEKAAFNQAEALIERLEQEIDELKKKETGLKQLYGTEDHIHFLQNFNYLCTPTDDSFIPRVTVNPDFSFSAVRKAVAEIKDRLEEFGREELLKISKSVNDVPVYTTESRTLDRRSRGKEIITVDSLPITPEPKSRGDFLKYFCQLKLDPNTAYKELYISDSSRKVIRTRDLQAYADTPERFDSFAQVLCREALSSGRFYWEIEWSGEFSIGVAYKSLSRKGKGSLCLLGYNNKSWSLLCSDTGYSAWHNRVDKAVSGPHSPRIGVYLDHTAGVLAFYAIGSSMTLLHRFESKFVEPVYPGFGVGTSVKICNVK
uniref:Uncharacterized protein n=1 Tax=Knipowitschia caucasica TaxID=637954 RepID=A0AAV2JCM4_KNICA